MSDSDGCDFDCTCTTCKGRRRVKRIAETSDSDSDSPVENAAKRKKVLRVMSDGAATSSDSDAIIKPARKKTYKLAPRVESDEDCSSPTEVRGMSDEDSGPSQFRKKRSVGTAILVSSASESESNDGEYSYGTENLLNVDEEEDADSSDFDEDETDEDYEGGSSSSGWESDWASHSESDVELVATDFNCPPTANHKSPPISSLPTNVELESDSSCDATTERCPICLRSFGSQEVATPATCDHSFCAICLQEWAKNINTCPVDRTAFTSISVRRRRDGKLVREIPVEPPAPPDDDEEIVEDPTFCEVCRRSDREDRMLLCDGCDSGYHLDCLTPPLENVPIEQWFCIECVASNAEHISGESGIADGELNALIEDAHAIGWSPPRPRVQRLLPRTRQSERVRATIRTRHALEASASRPSTSSGIDSQGSASRQAAATPARPRARRPKTSGKRRKKRKVKSSSRQRAGTSSGTRKKATATGKKRKKTKSKKKFVRRRRRHARKAPRTAVSKSVRSRLADQLGIRAPKIAGQVIPRGVAKKGASGFGCTTTRITTLHIFGQPNQLDYFGSGSEEDVGGGDSAVSTSRRPRTSAARNERNLAHRKLLSAGAVRSHAPVPRHAPTGSADLISGILNSQTVWHSRSSQVSINRDRTFTVVPPPTAPVDVRTARAAVTQAPMLPVRGGGTSRTPEGNFVPGGRSFVGAACQGGGFQSGGGSAANEDTPGGGGYGGYVPPPANLPCAQPLGNEERGWKSETDDEEDEDIDIYSDIEVGGRETEGAFPLPPPPLPPMALVGACEGAASDDNSDTELVIDDNVPQAGSPAEADKYNPAEPCSDSSSRELPVSSPVPNPEVGGRVTPAASPVAQFDSSSSMPEGAVSKAVKEVLKVHLETSTAASALRHGSDDDEEDDDDECPNFSIYSAVSMDIARNTDSDPAPAEQVRLESPPCQQSDGSSSGAEDDAREGGAIGENSVTREGSEARAGSETREESEAKEDKHVSDHEDISADVLMLGDEVKKNDSASLLTVDGLKLKAGLGDIFASDEESLVGGATSPVSATSSAHTPPQPITGLEGLETEAISEAEEAAHFDDLSETSFATVDEDGEIPSDRRRKKRRDDKAADSSRETADYEEGEIVDERPKAKAKDIEVSGETKVSDENTDVSKKPPKGSEDDKAKKKKKATEKGQATKDRSVLSSKENKDKNGGKEDPNISWKKPSKAKERNYRDGKQAAKEQPPASKEKDSSRKDKDRKDKDRRKDKREDLERYNVRKMVDSKKRSRRRDPFGRDLSRDRSFTRSRSKDSKGRRRSRSPSAKTRRRSRSKDSKGRRRSRSKDSKSRRKSRSKDSKERGKRLLRKSPAKKQRSRTKSRHRSRSRSPKRPRAKARSRTPERLKGRSRSADRMKGRSRSPDRMKGRSRSPDRMKGRSRSADRGKRYSPARGARKRTRSRNRSRLRSRSRSFVRSRKGSDRGKPAFASKRRSVSPSWTPSWSRSGSYSRSSMSSSPGSSRRKQFRSFSRSLSRTWTPEPHMAAIAKATGGMKNAKKLTVTVSNTKEAKKKKKDKKKKIVRKKNTQSVLEKRKKRKDKSPPPSKEVFTSGDNILVSVSFNKSSKQLSKEAVAGASDAAKRKLGDDGNPDAAKKLRKDKTKASPKPKGIQARLGAAKKPKKTGPKLTRVQAAAKRKPMAIIDLDQSPFREQTPSPADLIVLSDSEDEATKGRPGGQSGREASGSPKGSSKTGTNTATNVSESQSPILGAGVGYLASATGPKTPPEPQVKFSIAAKATLRAMLNPLHEEDEDEEEEEQTGGNGDGGGGAREAGPNTPPEPRGPTTPFSPTSPDAYDPFDPTKSNSPSPAREDIEPDVASPVVDLTAEPTESREEPVVEPLTEPVLTPPPADPAPVAALVSPSCEAPRPAAEPPTPEPEPEKAKPSPIATATAEPDAASPERPVVQTPPAKPAPTAPVVLPAPSPVFSLFSAAMLRTPPPVVARAPFSQPPPMLHHLPHVFLTSPLRLPMIVSDKPLRLPLLSEKPKMQPKVSPQKAKATPLRAQNGEQKAGPDKTDVVDMELESPYSPASSEANDLFNPPADAGKHRASPIKKHKSPLRPGADKFDTIFGASPLAKGKRRPVMKHLPKGKGKPTGGKHDGKGKPKKEIGIKMNEDKLQILDELPSSAVELQVKDKYLKKLNRQERVVEEVKLSLKPHYAKKHVTKEEYKDILRRSVPKICHNKSGEINPQKIASLVEAYVKKARYNKKKPGGAAKRGKTQAYS